MRRINDRLILGVLAGVLGNIPKTAIELAGKKTGWAESDCPARAAGMLVPRRQVRSQKGKIIGRIADTVMAAVLGVATTYALSATGKDKAVLKGVVLGQTMWTLLYGVLGTLGATRVKPVQPRTVLTELVGHTLYGATTAGLAVALGDPGLFTGKIPYVPVADRPRRSYVPRNAFLRPHPVDTVQTTQNHGQY